MRASLLVLLLAACASESTTETPSADTVPHVLLASSRADAAELPTVLVADAEIADSVSQAAALWTEATGGTYQARVIIADAAPNGAARIVLVDEITDCNAPVVWGCHDPATNLIEISRVAPKEVWVGTVTHELGHTLGLADIHVEGKGGLMDLDRSMDARRAPCVDTVTLEAAGFDGPGACLTP